jgi:hypothetical protein
MTFLNDSVKAGTRTSLDVPNTSSMIDQVLVSGA